MEIEKKYLIDKHNMPADLTQYVSHEIEQGYLCREPVLRVRKMDNDFWFTYKSAGLMVREEIERPLTAAAYASLREKTEGRLIQKTRYCIPYGSYTIELDVFHGDLAPLVLAEVEFPSEEEAVSFVPPDWFAADVTTDSRYQNSCLSQ